MKLIKWNNSRAANPDCELRVLFDFVVLHIRHPDCTWDVFPMLTGSVFKDRIARYLSSATWFEGGTPCLKPGYRLKILYSAWFLQLASNRRIKLTIPFFYREETLKIVWKGMQQFRTHTLGVHTPTDLERVKKNSIFCCWFIKCWEFLITKSLLL